LAAAAGTVALAGDGILLEPNRPRIVRKDFFLTSWPERLDGFTIALLSDFHFDPYFSVHPLHAAIPMVNRLRPDLIVLAGDFVSVPWFGDVRKGAVNAEPCARLLRQMTAPHGLWAVLGNHDEGTDPEHVTSALQAEGIQVLANQSQAIERDGGRVWLAGVNDVFSGMADLAQTLRRVPAGEAVVLLVHEPDFADEAFGFPVDCNFQDTLMEAKSEFRCCLRFTCPSWRRSMFGALTTWVRSRFTPQLAWEPSACPYA
jgi:predicted MPP superfamily phosphohydrolase